MNLLCPPPVATAPSYQWGTQAKHADENELARFYLRTIEQSDYAERVSPLIGELHDVLDIGAGAGTLTRRALARGARWRAVEPNAAMGEALQRQRFWLAARDIRLELIACSWDDLPAQHTADSVVAFNFGATRHDAARFFDAVAPRARLDMTWVVAAQPGPSTFCLAGLLPPDLHGADMQPAFERTLEQLGPARAPDSIEFADWTCRVRFDSPHEAVGHFLDRLAEPHDTPRGREIGRRVLAGLELHTTHGVIASCPKRSAALRWSFATSSR